MDYHSEFRRSIDNPDDFWREQAEKIDWLEPPKTIWLFSLKVPNYSPRAKAKGKLLLSKPKV